MLLKWLPGDVRAHWLEAVSEQLNFHKKSNLLHFVLISDFSEEYKTDFNFRHCQLDPHYVPLFYVLEPEHV